MAKIVARKILNLDGSICFYVEPRTSVSKHQLAITRICDSQYILVYSLFDFSQGH